MTEKNKAPVLNKIWTDVEPTVTRMHTESAADRAYRPRADEHADSPYDCGGPRKLGGR
jgi:hypothetical protein